MLYPGALAIQQRVLPAYRASFFDLLAQACQGGLRLFAGQPLPNEAIQTASRLARAALTPARNRHLFHPRHPAYLCWQAGLLPWLETANPDALIVEANPRYLSTPRAIRWMRARARPVLGWGLGAPPAPPLIAWLRAGFLSQLDGILAYSQRGADEYRALGLFPPDRVFTAPNAVVPRPAGSPPDRPPHPEHPLTVLFVGRLQPRKRLDLLLHACAALPPEHQPRLIVVGDGPARPALQALARQVYPQAQFTGTVTGSHLDPYFSQADLFILPGTGGLAVQQAMSHALPVIVAQGDGTQGDLVRPSNGWQIPPDDLPALTAALTQALEDPARLRRLGAESFRIVQEEINLETMVQQFLLALQRVTPKTQP